MRITFSVNGVAVRLTEERWNHICRRHPELIEQIEQILQTIQQPDFVQQGDVGTLMGCKKFLHKYLVVVYKEVSSEDGFILTAYLTKHLRRRVTIWKL